MHVDDEECSLPPKASPPEHLPKSKKFDLGGGAYLHQQYWELEHVKHYIR